MTSKTNAEVNVNVKFGLTISDYLYRIKHMYSDRQAWANSVDPKETPKNSPGYTLFATHLTI